MAIKLDERGGGLGNALMAWLLVEELFLRLPWRDSLKREEGKETGKKSPLT